MTPFGMKGTKKLSDIFIDRKIPHRRRAEAWVVEDARGILWLVGVTTRESTRVTDATTSVVRARASFIQPGAE
jgi:tRNA(Ile)-lysidine synthase